MIIMMMMMSDIILIPGHASLEGNEVAHAAARVHTHRAVPQQGDSEDPALRLYSLPPRYADTLAHYRHERRKFPPPRPPTSPGPKRQPFTGSKLIPTPMALYFTPCTPLPIPSPANSAPYHALFTT